MGHEVHGSKHTLLVPLMGRTLSPLLCTNPVIDQLSSSSSCSDGRTDIHLAKGVFSKVWLFRQKGPGVVCHFFKGHLYLCISLLSSPSHDCIAHITISVYHIDAGTICNVHEHLQCLPDWSWHPPPRPRVGSKKCDQPALDAQEAASSEDLQPPPGKGMS